MIAPQYEYSVVTIPALADHKITSEVLTVEINRVAKYGWRLHGNPVSTKPSQAIAVPFLWVLTFERVAVASE